MWKDILGPLGTLLWPPEHEDVQGSRAWRRTVAATLMLSSCASVFLMAAVSVGVPLLGEIAWARSVDHKTEQKVEQAMAPVTKAIDDNHHALSDINSTVSSILAANAATEIRTLKRAMCLLPNRSERDRMQGEIDQAAENYYNYAKHPYNVSALKCGELL